MDYTDELTAVRDTLTTQKDGWITQMNEPHSETLSLNKMIDYTDELTALRDTLTKQKVRLHRQTNRTQRHSNNTKV